MRQTEYFEIWWLCLAPAGREGGGRARVPVVGTGSGGDGRATAQCWRVVKICAMSWVLF